MVTQEQADRIEAKLDKVIEFTEQAKAALETFANGPMSKVFAAMTRSMGAGR